MGPLRSSAGFNLAVHLVLARLSLVTGLCWLVKNDLSWGYWLYSMYFIFPPDSTLWEEKHIFLDALIQLDIVSFIY